MQEISLALEPTGLRQRSREFLFPAALTALFALLTAMGLMRHEIWRDEAQAWLIAVHSANPWELWQHMRYEGHPALWQGLLWVASRLSADPVLMQILQGLIATASAAIIAFKAPFGRLQKIGLIFGYYMAFEYALISRAYGLGVLLLWAALALYRPEKPRWGLLGLCLLLMTQTSAYGAILALALGLTLALAHVQAGQGLARQPWRGWAALGLPLAVGLVAFAVQARPPLDFLSAQPLGVPNQPLWLHLTNSLQRLWYGFVPLPNFFRFYFWDSNVFSPSPKVTVFGLLLFGFFAAMWRNRRAALTFYLLATGGLLLFTFFVYLGFSRHYGHFFIAVMAAAWLAAKFPASAPPEGKEDSWVETRLVPFAERQGERVLLALLAVQLVAGQGSWIRDVMTPFSQAKQTAEFLKTQLGPNRYLAGASDFGCTAVSAYVQQPLYSPVINRDFSYIVWDKTRATNLSTLFPPLVEKMNREQKDCLLVLNFGLALQQGKGVESLAGQRIEQDDFYLTELKQFRGAIVTDENFYVYLLERKSGRVSP